MGEFRRNKMNVIEQWLESDDELPDDYFETPMAPNYLNDDRFLQRVYKQSSNKNQNKKYENVPKEPNSTLKGPKPINTLEKYGRNDALGDHVINTLLTNCEKKPKVFRYCDVICLQSVKNYAEADVFLWFENFVILKDSQSSFKFLKSCLTF